MRKFSGNVQFGVSVAVGIGTAICSNLLFLAVTSMLNKGRGGVWVGSVIMFATFACGGIVSGLILRLMTDRRGAGTKSFVAKPATYLVLLMFFGELVEPSGGLWIWFVAPTILAVTWPVTFLAYRKGQRAPEQGTSPICPKCDYNLTGNVSGICPERRTPINSAGPTTSSR